jgi:hypothetical protein
MRVPAINSVNIMLVSAPELGLTGQLVVYGLQPCTLAQLKLNRSIPKVRASLQPLASYDEKAQPQQDNELGDERLEALTAVFQRSQV